MFLGSFGDERKRRINLGGASSAASQSDILGQVHAQRAERAEHRRRIDNAVKIQAWYRGVKDMRSAREEMRRMFECDITGITGLRCLVLMGRDENAYARWCQAQLSMPAENVYKPASEIHRTSWLVLIRKVALFLLESLARDPHSQNSLVYLRFLKNLLSFELARSSAGDNGATACVVITDYLVKHAAYKLLRESIRNIPLPTRSSPSLPLLLDITVAPFTTFKSDPTQLGINFAEFVGHILSIPLLPNLALPYLTSFTPHLPLSRMELLDPYIPSILNHTSVEDKVNLSATLFAFVSPAYKMIPPQSTAAYLRLSNLLFNSFQISNLQVTPKKNASKQSRNPQQKKGEPDSIWHHDHGYDSDEINPTRVEVVQSFSAYTTPVQPSNVDEKTLDRLQKVVDPNHITELLNTTINILPTTVSYLFSLTTCWEGVGGVSILDTVLTLAGGRFVKEIYLRSVRGSPLGKDEDEHHLMAPTNAPHWSPFLFLVDLYSRSLLTMGDDEFFGLNVGGNRAFRNPLSLDELVSFSRQLLNIAFTLYWRDDQSSIQFTKVSPDVNCSWQAVREKVTKCLSGIHSRDSRKPFVPKGHWLVTSQLDMKSFVEAAVLEDQQLSQSETPFRNPSRTQLASMSPRLGILNNIPFAIPFEVRVSMFRHFVLNDRASRGDYDYDHFMRGRLRKAKVQVRRGMIAEDGFNKLGDIDLKAPVEISFIDQFGREEAGIDGGGVFKEFFTSLCQEVFHTDRGLWLANKKNELYPNPHGYATDPHSLNWYRFLGRVLGKAMYDGILVDVAFAGFFLAQWLKKSSYLDDLASLDPDLYNGLIFLKHYDGNPEDLSLNFTAAVEEFGVTKSVDLIKDGSNTPVTKANRLAYIYLISHFRLSRQIRLQSSAFFEGLSELIDPKWLRMFNQQEVQVLIGGVNSPINLEDLRTHTNYGGLYDDSHPTIVAFWNVVNNFDQEQKRSLLRFVTSCSRPPLLGFKELVPNFSIRDSGQDQYRLPTSSTCVNLLKLPLYTTEGQLRSKLLQAINAGAGFDLS